MSMMAAWCDGKMDLVDADYFQKMRQDEEFVDHIFLAYIANLIKRDIVIVHHHASTVANGTHNYLPGM